MTLFKFLPPNKLDSIEIIKMNYLKHLAEKEVLK